jgi:hypothetical protein
MDSMGKNMEVTQYTEKLVPSTRFVAVDGVGPTVNPESFIAPSASVIGNVTVGKHTRCVSCVVVMIIVVVQNAESSGSARDETVVRARVILHLTFLLVSRFPVPASSLDESSLALIPSNCLCHRLQRLVRCRHSGGCEFRHDW